MPEKIKKIGEICVTPETLNLRFPKNCIVNCKTIHMELIDFPVLLRKKTSVKYEVFGRKKEDIKRAINKITGDKYAKDY